MKRFKHLLVVIICITGYSTLSAQNLEFDARDYNINPFGSIKVENIVEDWNFRLNHFPDITQGNRSYRQHLYQLKLESAERFPRVEYRGKSQEKSTSILNSNVPSPAILSSFQGNQYNFSAPNDNTLAISNGGQLVSAVNTNINFYDLNLDSLLRTLSLNNFSVPLTGISNNQYDPRVIYDPAQDRFIIIFLAGASSDTKTDIVVAFSETNDMMGNWNLYSLPGNPLNDTSWTDFPAVALTEDELFVTANLLDYGTSWQTSFRQTIIWQVNKFDGYNGQTLNSRLWSNIFFDGTPLRNMHPVQSGDKLLGPNIYLLSNKNFTLYSDTIFLLEITGNLKQETSELKLKLLKSDVGYGAPPDAGQPNTTNKLATNDARVLDGFIHNNTIQFVGNTIDTTNGKAVIYHGLVTNVNRFPEVKLNLITEPGMEFGYPAISFSGNTLFSQQSIIGFNHTGDTAFPGVSAIFYDGAGGYSQRAEIKTGEQIINIFAGNYERWGDYTGNQRKYNEPGKVWISGMYGYRSGLNARLGTQIAEVSSAVTEKPIVTKGRTIDAALYPNPVSNLFGMEFTLDNQEDIIIELRSIAGQRLHRFYEGPVKAGKNSLSFTTDNLAQGVHLLFILDKNGKVMFSERIVKIKE